MGQGDPRVLVVYKKSVYQLHVLERRDAHLRRLLRAKHPDALDMQQAHAAHQRTLRAVAETLRRLRLNHRLVYRADLRTASRYDLAISVGGDGTLLQVSHVVENIPILGVNSDPTRSEAVFCAATRNNFERMLRRTLAGTLPSMTLHRVRIRLNSRWLQPLALNDVLVAHEDPATMSRYRLRIGARREDQKSSGLWVSTAAGSSSAILASGGNRLPWTAKRFQYRPRELYQGRLTHGRLTGGSLPASAVVEVTWLTREGSLFIDGPHVHHPLRFGDRIAIQLAPDHPLRILGLRPTRDRSHAR